MRVTEFHSIMPIENIPSILKHGILSHESASKLKHVSVALQEVQDSRDATQVPSGLKLHQYANIYFHARNPMMSKRRGDADKLCVLQITPEILKISGTVITDQNAASRFVKFYHPNKIRHLNLQRIFAPNWKHPENKIEEWRHSSAKCAEVLIPNQLPVSYLMGAYVVGPESKKKLIESGFNLPITIDSDLFFR